MEDSALQQELLFIAERLLSATTFTWQRLPSGALRAKHESVLRDKNGSSVEWFDSLGVVAFATRKRVFHPAEHSDAAKLCQVRSALDIALTLFENGQLAMSHELFVPLCGLFGHLLQRSAEQR